MRLDYIFVFFRPNGKLVVVRQWVLSCRYRLERRINICLNFIFPSPFCSLRLSQEAGTVTSIHGPETGCTHFTTFSPNLRLQKLGFCFSPLPNFPVASLFLSQCHLLTLLLGVKPSWTVISIKADEVFWQCIGTRMGHGNYFCEKHLFQNQL